MLTSQTVWITGASSGIGKALAEYFYERGWNVVLSSRRADALEDVKSGLLGGKGTVWIVPLDLENYEKVEKHVSSTLPNLPPIDVLINNGGVSQRAPALETELSVTKKILDINFMGTLAMTRAILPGMVARKSGSIIVISSVTGKVGTPWRSTYAASKHALHGYFDSLRAEMSQHRIHVMMVCPGYISTDISLNAMTGTGTKHSQMDENQQKGKSPKQLAEAIFKNMEQRKSEFSFGGKEVIGILLKRYFPSILEKIVAKSGVPK